MSIIRHKDIVLAVYKRKYTDLSYSLKCATFEMFLPCHIFTEIDNLNIPALLYASAHRTGNFFYGILL